MNGAESLIRTAAAAGVEVCFANPGTTEMQLVAALDDVPDVRPVLAMFEGVCSGAADGYARIAGKPALTLTHLGPGFANSIANLHNARRARTPIVNIVGDHATWHVAADAPLTSDIESLARPVSGWVRTSTTAAGVAAVAAAAVEAAMRPPGQVATLIVPQDCQWEEADGPAPAPSLPVARDVGGDSIEVAARTLREETPAVLFLGGAALLERGLRAASRIAAATGCRLLGETFAARYDRGARLPVIERLAYFPEQALEALEGTRTLLLAGTLSPVAFFGYPDMPSSLVPEGTSVTTLAEPGDDVTAALEALADAVDAPADVAVEDRERPPAPSGELTVGSLGQALAALLPEDAIVSDEPATSGAGFAALAAAAPPHTVMGLTGGAIGQGLPCAVGAAIAAPDRRVLAFQADGGGMYTLQSLWTMAREELDVTVVIASNGAYRILQVELARAGIAEPGPRARALTDLTNPPLDWARLAQGMGVPGVRAETADELVAALEQSFAEPGPSLIEAIV
jgi:acetolactate synthase-1/2/3 large subunit